MKVTKEMTYEGLRSYLFLLRMLTPVFKYKPLTKFMNSMQARTKGKDVDGLVCEEVYIDSSDGSHSIRVRIYRPPDSDGELPAMLYLHGGGLIMGVPEVSGDFYHEIISKRKCVIVAPDYRKAYAKPYPGAFDDCYDTLLWLKNNSATLGVSPNRVMVAGHSAGGGLTAAVTLKARDTGDVNIAFQMPIYPMIDDQQPHDPERDIDSYGWNTDANRVAWSAYLADLNKLGSVIPAYAAPARNTNYRDLPPTITFVGSLEPFYWETVSYVKGLKEAGVEVAFAEYEGCYHAFEMVFPEVDISKKASTFLFESYAKFYDQYVIGVAS